MGEVSGRGTFRNDGYWRMDIVMCCIEYGVDWAHGSIWMAFVPMCRLNCHYTLIIKHKNQKENIFIKVWFQRM